MTTVNIDDVQLASAARSADTASPDEINNLGRGAYVIFDVTAIPSVSSAGGAGVTVYDDTSVTVSPSPGWAVNEWVGYIITATGGKTLTITSNTANKLTGSGTWSGSGNPANDAAFTSDVGDETVTLKVQGKDPASGKYYNLIASSAVNTVSTTVVQVHPDAGTAADGIAKTAAYPLPYTWRILVDHAGTAQHNFTYSVGAQVVL